MKLKTVFQLLKAKRRIILYESNDGQWIGDGSAAFPLHGLPPMKQENLRSLLDVTEKQFAQIDVSSQRMLFSTEDNVIGEIMLTHCGAVIHYRGYELIPLTSGTKIYYVQSGYIKPFGGIDDISYDLRKLENGSEYIAVKEGFLLRVVIAPLDAVTDELVGILGRIYSLSMNALSEKRDRRCQNVERSEFQNLAFEEEHYE